MSTLNKDKVFFEMIDRILVCLKFRFQTEICPRFFRTRIRTGSGEMYEEYNFSIMYLPYLTFQKKRGKK
ncbi:hypothetical protein LEP1GSC179_0224 [Leptospira santarosai str. MOR084]|uniref:Uncharacterized protein n=1 Tax=Leptospira santarosai str. MOR084 TaxID=1049984 RepID=A0A0E2BKZ9_9LEPT|nr:hypothetical protein LEP1GSC179_0224 [Leptospira santarosai str. MOR084]